MVVRYLPISMLRPSSRIYLSSMRIARRSLFFNWPAPGTPTLHAATLLNRRNIPLPLPIYLRDLWSLFSRSRCPHEDKLRRTTALAWKVSYSNAVLTQEMFQKHLSMSRQRLPSYPPTASLLRAESRHGKILLHLPFVILSNLLTYPFCFAWFYCLFSF